MGRGPLNLIGTYAHAKYTYWVKKHRQQKDETESFLGDELYQYEINLQCLKD